MPKAIIKRRKRYHTFRRELPNGKLFEKTCLEKPGIGRVTIHLTVPMLDRAMKMDGQADSQNCGGSFCVSEQAECFKHPVGYLVDWWRSRVLIDEGHGRKPVCRVYAHYDQTEELFDTDFYRLRKKVERCGPVGLALNLYPVRPGMNTKTGKPSHSGPSGPSGKRRPPIGAELRLLSYLRARKAVSDNET
jgi:hypothetical protein